ncbi:GTPase activating protein 1 [Amborella trichopoda]|nr:GTPase activating protein 1 [Amborella trichopoda]|eukprot:XP_006843797.2 GTPase activating protein 1 [Amborella trichopoda]
MFLGLRQREREKEEMEKGLTGLLRVQVIRGVNLAVRDLLSSDPYVILSMGKQRLKTRVIKRNTNPTWNENLTLVVSNPIMPIKFRVYDKDTFSRDDKMGDAELDIQPFMEAVNMDLKGVPSGTIIRKLIPSRQNCLAEVSCISWEVNTVVQDVCLRLRNVERGEVELQLKWIPVQREMIS